MNVKQATASLIAGVLLISGNATFGFIPTYQQDGYYYAKFVDHTYTGSRSERLPADQALATALPYGTNVGYAIYFQALHDNVSSYYFDQAYISLFYNYYLGGIYAYYNYQYPAYASQLASYYQNYGENLSDYYNSIAFSYQNYYGPVANYYYDLVF